MSSTAQRDVPLTEKVVVQIRDEIGSGKLEPGRYLPSERELCRQFEVSRFTVRSALTALVNEGLLERRPSRGYMVHASKEGKANRGSGSALLFIHAHPEEDLLTGYHARMWAGARLQAARLGTRILISSVYGERASQEQAEEIRRIAAGVMVDCDDEEWIEAFLGVGLKVVRVDHMQVHTDAPKLNTIVQDDYEGISALLEHLHARGHRRIGFLDPSCSFEPRRRGHCARRLGAYFGECRRLEMGIDPTLVAEVCEEEMEKPDPTLKLIDAGATAVITSHSYLRTGATAAMKERGLKVGGDFGLVVYGEPTGNGDDKDYPTHAAWSKEQMGREAVRRLFAAIDCPDDVPVTVKISTELVDRETGGKGPQA